MGVGNVVALFNDRKTNELRGDECGTGHILNATPSPESPRTVASVENGKLVMDYSNKVFRPDVICLRRRFRFVRLCVVVACFTIQYKS